MLFVAPAVAMLVISIHSTALLLIGAHRSLHTKDEAAARGLINAMQ